MREKTPSWTAAYVAATRALGALLPPEALLADDPYGMKFVTVRAPRAGSAAVKWLAPLRTLVVFMQVRTRILDDALVRFAADGGRQVVLLGAGYDCRALRFSRELSGTTVFEVDHPATQGHKRRVLGDAPAGGGITRYIPWDFESRPMSALPAALAGAGHDAAAPTLTIWEGVTMYLTPAAIDASVRAVRAYSAVGSQLAMTYATRDVIDRPKPTGRFLSAILASIGEPYRFGWDRAELPSWLGERGFEQSRDVAIADEARRLLPAWWARGAGDATRRISLARATESVVAPRP